jgi:hypothetical protein
VWLDYAAQNKTAIITARLLPGTHHVQTWEGNFIYFTVASNGTVDYDPALEGALTGRGTSSLRVNGRSVTIDLAAFSGSLFQIDYVSYSANSPVTVALLPGQHFINIAGNVYYFTVSNDGYIDYAAAYDGILTGRATKKLGLVWPPVNS